VPGVERGALAVAGGPTVEIVVPVYNEERDLEPSVRRLRAYLDARFPFHATVTIADVDLRPTSVRCSRWSRR
jgi:hypothetical protein